MFKRSLILAAVAVFAAQGFSQTDPDEEQQEQGGKINRKLEREKFHPTKVKGMSAEVRAQGWAQHQKLAQESFFGGVKWKNVGPEVQGGRVVDIKASLADPNQLYVAFATGGLYRTEDDGITWKSLFDTESAMGIGAIAVSPDGKTLWVGSGEANNQRTSYSGTGIFKSTDGGATWQNMGLPESHHIARVVVDPKHPDTVWVAVIGHLYSQNQERGLYKTTDGGKSWELVLKGDDYTGCIDVIVDPKNPNVVVAAMYDRDRRAWNYRESGDGSAMYRSDNGGKSWTKIAGLPSGDNMGRVGLAVCESKPNVMYAMIENPGKDPDWADLDDKQPSGKLTPRRFALLTEETILQVDEAILNSFLDSYGKDLTAKKVVEDIKSGKTTVKKLIDKMEADKPGTFSRDAGCQVFRSDDNGRTWKKPASADLGPFGGYYYNTIFVNPKDPDEVYVSGVPILRSTNGGKSWASVARVAHVDYHAVWFDPRDPKKTWYGNDGGLYVSRDGGTSVRHVNNLSVAQATTLAIDNATPYNIYIGLQDNGTMKGPSNYNPGRSDINLWTAIGGGDGSAVATDPREELGLVYTASQFGAHSAQQTMPPGRWSARATGAGLRYNWVSPILLSPHHPDIVYLGANKLFRSFNKGRAYKAISPDLTKNKPNGNVPFSTIKDVSESPLRFGLIYVGCDDGNVKMTPDGGITWKDIATPQPDKWVTRVVASKYEENTVFVSQNGYREDDFSPYLWKSTDNGRNWTSIAANLPNEPINVIREDPSKPNVLYVGTDGGVYVSFDSGKSWEALPGGLPNQPVHDIAIQDRERELVIATHARGAYTLPLGKVFSVTKEMRDKDITDFKADDESRSSTWGFDPSKPIYDKSAPRNPMVDVTFFTNHFGKATLRLLDKDGKAVITKAFDAIRGYNATQFGLEIEPGKPFTVDIHKRLIKTAKDALADPLDAERPKYLPNGTYTLELTIGDFKTSKPWKLTD